MTRRLTDIADIRMANTAPYPYLIFYRVEGGAIVVTAVRHGARNPRKMPARPR